MWVYKINMRHSTLKMEDLSPTSVERWVGSEVGEFEGRYVGEVEGRDVVTLDGTRSLEKHIKLSLESPIH